MKNKAMTILVLMTLLAGCGSQSDDSNQKPNDKVPNVEKTPEAPKPIATPGSKDNSSGEQKTPSEGQPESDNHVQPTPTPSVSGNEAPVATPTPPDSGSSVTPTPTTTPAPQPVSDVANDNPVYGAWKLPPIFAPGGVDFKITVYLRIKPGSITVTSACEGGGKKAFASANSALSITNGKLILLESTKAATNENGITCRASTQKNSVDFQASVDELVLMKDGKSETLTRVSEIPHN